MLLAFSIVVCLASLARRRHLRSDIVKFRTEDGIGSNHFTTLTQISNCLFSTLYSFQTNIKFSLEWSVYQQLTTFIPRTSSMHFSYYTMMHMQYLSLKGLLERKWQITSMLQMCNILYWRCDIVEKQFSKIFNIVATANIAEIVCTHISPRFQNHFLNHFGVWWTAKVWFGNRINSC